MKKLCLVLCCAALCMLARGQKFPLGPLHADSIYLMDFFWDGLQQKAERAATPKAKPQAYPWETKKLSSSQLKKMTTAWEQTTERIALTGESKDNTPSLRQSLNLFYDSYQLGLHTGHARYMDLAERILANSILRQWKTDSDPEARAEARRLMQSIDRFIYSVSGKDVYLNMFTSCNAHLVNKDIDIYLQNVGKTPWYNETAITFVSNMTPFQIADQDMLNAHQRIIRYNDVSTDSCEVTFHIRIPSWANGKDFLKGYDATSRRSIVKIIVNGTTMIHPEIVNGYAVVKGKWTLRDVIGIKISTPILRVTDKSNPGEVALQRGPFVYTFLNPSEQSKLDVKSSISHTYSQTDSTMVLSGMMNNGETVERFFAVPYYQNREKTKLFIPKK